LPVELLETVMVQLHPVCVSQCPVELVGLACLPVAVAALEFTTQTRISLHQTHPFCCCTQLCYTVILHVYFMLKQSVHH